MWNMPDGQPRVTAPLSSLRYTLCANVCENSEERIPPMSSAISGNLHVANDVLADLVGNAAMECYGVVGVCAPNAAACFASLGVSALVLTPSALYLSESSIILPK